MIKKSVRKVLVGIVIATVLTTVGCSNVNSVSNIIDFEAKFIACKEIELNGLYDKINGMLTEKEYVDIRRADYENYKKIKADAFDEVKDLYEEFLDIMGKNVTNYASVSIEDKQKEIELGQEIIKMLGQINEEKNIDMEVVSQKTDGYIEQFKKD